MTDKMRDAVSCSVKRTLPTPPHAPAGFRFRGVVPRRASALGRKQNAVGFNAVDSLFLTKLVILYIVSTYNIQYNHVMQCRIAAVDCRPGVRVRAQCERA